MAIKIIMDKNCFDPTGLYNSYKTLPKKAKLRFSDFIPKE